MIRIPWTIGLQDTWSEMAPNYGGLGSVATNV
jgi:hypothetical protein